MFRTLLTFSLHQRLVVFFLAILLGIAGGGAFRNLPIDAFPDVTPIQVQILTEARGLSPIEVEKFITFPLELVMTGLPDLGEIRSRSRFGLSQLTVVFKEGTDIHLARQLVLERLIDADKMLPEGIEPSMAPNTTGLGEVFQYYLDKPGEELPKDPQEREHELIQRRTIQDWIIRPILKSVPGVIDVSGFGGLLKQYQAFVNPALLRKYDLSIQDVYRAAARNNANAGGNVLERNSERYTVRGVGLIKTLDDIENIVVKEAGGTPVYVRDIAEAKIGHAVRQGAVVLNGEREVVAGIVMKLRGANAREVVDGVKEKIKLIHDEGLLPDGLRIVPFYDRSELITAALHTVRKALLEGVLFVILVLF